MCLVLGLFLGTVDNSSIPLLSSKSVHLACNLASGMSKMGFNYKINSLSGNTSLAVVDSTIYSASVVDMAISFCNQLNHVIGHPAYFITHPVLDFTEL